QGDVLVLRLAAQETPVERGQLGLAGGHGHGGRRGGLGPGRQVIGVSRRGSATEERPDREPVHDVPTDQPRAPARDSSPPSLALGAGRDRQIVKRWYFAVWAGPRLRYASRFVVLKIITSRQPPPTIF